MSTKKTYCVNCGKTNHSIKECSDPVFSYGIICFKFDDKINVSSSNIIDDVTALKLSGKYISESNINILHDS